ncbi:hypothetical protein Pint_09890 [Pistacia integerrima]|uniref:Uncharacterized protein n=1 Tax=Pistacia integerrima TaxID=434235 RepID=A0ACC0XNA6_9ROSI|nr:hypothetical protein Pint_09890 [Pistacia integerrima]
MSSSSAEKTKEQEPEQIRIKKKPNGTGRKKIEMKKIEKNSSRKVAFSKRRKEFILMATRLLTVLLTNFRVKKMNNDNNQKIKINISMMKINTMWMMKEGSISLSHEENCDCVSENSAAEAAEEGGKKEKEEEEGEEEKEEYWWEEDIEGLELQELERRRACMEELRDNMALSLEETMVRRYYERDLFGK